MDTKRVILLIFDRIVVVVVVLLQLELLLFSPLLSLLLKIILSNSWFDFYTLIRFYKFFFYVLLNSCYSCCFRFSFSILFSRSWFLKQYFVFVFPEAFVQCIVFQNPCGRQRSQQSLLVVNDDFYLNPMYYHAPILTIQQSYHHQHQPLNDAEMSKQIPSKADRSPSVDSLLLSLLLYVC